ncbi:MAG TPA: metalloregulator ArsR/SmtB family transcription factor [Clostridia bacterium]|nr:metalloregulator ArsR/SmtB family transcription factor [Clostridia bacterium]
MEHLTFHPLDLRLEAAGALTRLAYRGDNERSGDLRTAVDYYCKKYNTDRSRFAGMLEAYDHLKANLVCDEQELITLFGFADGMETNIYDLIRQIRFNLGDELVHDLNLRIALAISDESIEAKFERVDVSDLLEYAQGLPIADPTKLLFADAVIRFDEYETRVNRMLDQAEALLREKAHLLEPYAEKALADWNALQGEDAFFDQLALEGIRLDCPHADVTPIVMQFTTIYVHSNILTAQYLGKEEQTTIYYGVLVDEYTRTERTGKTDLESIANLLHALDDKKRLQILVALRERPLYGQELAAVTELSPGTVSHHMGELVGSGLVKIEKQGVKLLYSISEQRFREFTAMLDKSFLR